jgi:hypothetical protein
MTALLAAVLSLGATGLRGVGHAVHSLLLSRFSAWRCRYSVTTSSAFSCRLAAIEAIHRCKKLCLIRSLPIKSGEVQTDWIVMGASDRAMLVPSSYRGAVTPCVKHFTEFADICANDGPASLR